MYFIVIYLSKKVGQLTISCDRALILNPGEAVVIPQNWWHYAVALETSITVMKNFYHADTNISSLVRQVWTITITIAIATTTTTTTTCDVCVFLNSLFEYIACQKKRKKEKHWS